MCMREDGVTCSVSVGGGVVEEDVPGLTFHLWPEYWPRWGPIVGLRGLVARHCNRGPAHVLSLQIVVTVISLLIG